MVTILADRIVKVFSAARAYEQERDIYARNPAFAPRLLDDNGVDTLTIERVEGVPLIERENPDFHACAQGLAALHKLRRRGQLVLAMNDTNPRNFLQSDSRTWLIDFSDATLHFPEPDVIHFLLFWAANQSHAMFQAICSSFLKGYTELMRLDGRRWLALAPSVISRFDERRQLFGKAEKHAHRDATQNRNHLQRIASLHLLT